jgi:tape measure domain-containing protein
MADQVLGNLVWKITGDTSGFDNKISSAAKRMDKFGKTAVKVGSNLTKFSTLPILALGTASVVTAAKIETQRVAFGKLLKDVDRGNKLFEKLKKFSAETPLQLEDITTGAQKLLAFGIAEEDVIEKLTRLGDAALGNSATLSRLTNAYGKVQAKGKATLEELNLFTEAGVPIMQELSKQYGLTTQEMFKFIEAGKLGFADVDKALTSLTSEGGQFAGVMEAIAETTAGKFSTAVDNVKLAGAELGAILLPTIKDILDDVISLSRQFQGLDETTKKTIVEIASFVAILGPLALGIGKVTLAVKALSTSALFGPLGIIVGIGLAAGAIIKLTGAFKDSEEEVSAAKERYRELNGELVAIGTNAEAIAVALQNFGKAIEKELEKFDKPAVKIQKDIDRINFLIKEFEKLTKEGVDKAAGNMKRLRDEFGLTIEEEAKFFKPDGLEALKSALAEAEKALAKIKAPPIAEGLAKLTPLLNEFEVAIKEAEIAELESVGSFKEAGLIKEELLENELEGVKRALGETKGAEKEKADAVKFFSDEILKVRDETAEKEKQLIKEVEDTRKAAIIQSFSAITNIASSFLNTMKAFSETNTENELEQLELQKQAALEAAGFKEETEIERLENELAKAEEVLALTNTAEDEAAAKSIVTEAEKDLEKAKINEEFEKKKADASFKGALAAWRLELGQTIIQGFMASISAYQSAAAIPIAGWILGPIAGAAAAAFGAVAVANVAKNKPSRGQFQDGTTEVPFTQEATIHRGEMIIPQPFAEDVRSGAASIGVPRAGNVMIQIVSETGDKLREWIYEGTKNGEIKIADTGLVTV